MILDQLKLASRYAAIHPGFDAAFHYLQHQDLLKVEPGKYKLDGDRLMAIVDKQTGRKKEGAKFENHRKYIDIQLTLAGDEVIGWKPTSSLTQVDMAYDDMKEVALWKDRPETWLNVPPGHFCIFFPDDAHAPLAGEGELRKVVVKVAVEW